MWMWMWMWINDIEIDLSNGLWFVYFIIWILYVHFCVSKEFIQQFIPNPESLPWVSHLKWSKNAQCFLLMQKVNVIVIIILLKELNESKKKESNSNYEIVYRKCSYCTHQYIRWFVCFALLFKRSSMFECKSNIGYSVITL